MRNVYFAVAVKGNDDDDNGKEKYYSYIIKANESLEIKGLLCLDKIIHANWCPTKKRAEEIVAFWNDCYRKNGTYLFDTPKF